MSDFLLGSGVKVPNLNGIHECYQVRQNGELFCLTANISADRLERLMECFCAELSEPCFFILEIPTNEADERLLRQKDTDRLHCDVYYCDGLSRPALLALLEKHGELLINDGMVWASHISGGTK